MRENIHPTWYSEAVVVCACGNTWKTGATVREIRTDICSACHPFYTGEQRIVDTEGQVDRFMKRLQVRDNKLAEFEAREAAKTPLDMPIADLGLTKRAVELLNNADIVVVQDFLDKLAQGGDEGLLEIPGIGRKIISDTKKLLRSRGYELPTSASAGSDEE